ncbi:MAG: T9SS type A sorting domain-containing protein [Ignavibacteriae bacterium]|nr:T9SS type A sorting domain-containing protein [Ignavibacteriota bacterium]MCB9260556.1 T9SS type A sorting domain-containing protein [Ignavibacteriales bacterium]
MKKITSFCLFILITTSIFSQDKIIIDGKFDDWINIPAAITDSSNNVHDTEGYVEGGIPAEFIEYSDVDILEVKFANDDSTLYGYMKAVGSIGRTSADSLGHAKSGRYYFIFTIDVDNNDTTGYPLREGGYYPDSKGYDMNMEVEFYNGAYNTGHYLNHEYISEADYNANWENDLAQGIVRLAPGTYDWYSQWVMFADSTYVVVEDKGPVYQGIIEIAISEDGHEAEMKAPFWGFLKSPEGNNIIDVNQTIIVSASLEASGELSEEAANLGYTAGSKSVWGSNTAEPFEYYIKSSIVSVEDEKKYLPESYALNQNYPNPFNPLTNISFSIPKMTNVKVEVFNFLGERVSELINKNLDAGVYSYNFDGKDLPSGIYFYRIITPEFSETKKMLLIK